MVISRTPFRISFFGGGTDYPIWYRDHGGTVLGTTIDKYCYLTCRYLPPFFKHRIRLVYSRIENCRSVEDIVHPAVREVLRFSGIERPEVFDQRNAWRGPRRTQGVVGKYGGRDGYIGSDHRKAN